MLNRYRDTLLATLLLRAGTKIRPRIDYEETGLEEASAFDVFFEPNALSINKARLDHLRSLQLDISGQTVLEVGAGIGLHTSFFEGLGCDVLSTDGREENVGEILRRFPNRSVRKVDLEEPDEVVSLGQFDIVFCYGALYHLSTPEASLQALSDVCRNMILLETRVTPGLHNAAHLVRENISFNSALRTVACRPTRPWVMEKLEQYWGYAYVSEKQPRHQDFQLDWVVPPDVLTHRAVFVGSKKPLDNPSLLDSLPDRQEMVVQDDGTT